MASNQCLGWHDQKLFRVTRCGGGFGRLKYHKHSAIYSDLHALCEGLRIPGLPHVTTPPCARVSPAEPQEHSTFWDKLTHQQYTWRNSAVKTFVDHHYNRLTQEKELMWYSANILRGFTGIVLVLIRYYNFNKLGMLGQHNTRKHFNTWAGVNRNPIRKL